MEKTRKKNISKNKKSKIIHICPKCGSINLQAALTIGPQKLAQYIATNKKHFEGIPMNKDCFLCKSCGDLGLCPTIEISEVERFRKQLKKQKPNKNPITSRKISLFQKWMSLILLAYIISLFVFMKSEYFFVYYFVSIPLLVVVFLIWIFYRIFKKKC